MNPPSVTEAKYLPYDERTQPPRWIDDYPRSKLRTPLGPFVTRPLTRSELTGPTALDRKMRMGPSDMSQPFPDQPRALGQYIYVNSRVLDEDGTPIPGAMVELWQANTSGKYIHEFDTNEAPVDPHFVGSMRVLTDEHGRFSFKTIKPGAYPVTISTWEWRAPHIHLSVFGDNWMTRLVTQLFFPGEPLLQQDLLLNAIPSPAARQRLIIRPLPTVVHQTGPNILGFEHEIVIRGKSATPTLIDNDEGGGSTTGAFAHMTTGPFFPPEFVEPGLSNLTEFDGSRAQGTRILPTGRVLDEKLEATVNTLVEVWQADANGVFRHPLDPRYSSVDRGFFGWGRANTDKQGWYRFETVLPGAYTDNDGRERVPHVNAMLMASGILRPLVTTAFFGDPATPVNDPVLDAVTDPERRTRLFAVREPSLDRDGMDAYRFDIVLRGQTETPFFLD